MIPTMSLPCGFVPIPRDIRQVLVQQQKGGPPMSVYDIEQWEKEMAEIEIRRWLLEHKLWMPELELQRLERQEEEERARTKAVQED